MSLEIESPLVRKSLTVLKLRFRDRFGEPSPLTTAPGHYRDLIAAALERRFGVPLPPALSDIVEDAGKLDIAVADLLDFLGQQFRLIDLPVRKGQA